MKKFVKSTLSLILVLATVFSVCSLIAASAAIAYPAFSSSKPIKAYTISTGNNTTAFTSTDLKTKRGTIYASDEIYITKIGRNSAGVYYAYCSYPISSGRKTAYIPLKVVTAAAAPSAVNTSSANITTYRRASTSTKAGSISKGDQVYKMTASGSYTQVLYNIGSASNPSGWRLAWVSTSAYTAYIAKSGNSTTQKPVVAEASSWQYPMKNAYCTWRTPGNNMSFGTYTKTGTNRTYHLGNDIWGDNGYVYAAANGKVVACSSSTSGANGRYIIIQHTISGKTVYSFYAHLASLNVSNGQAVSKGTRIATAGGSGYGSNSYYGKHLHFAIVDTLWSNGQYWGYATYFTGDKCTASGVTFYNPCYVIRNGRLPA